MSDRLPFELQFPGTWIELPDQQAAWEIQTQLSLVEGAFAEATIALILFEQSQRDATAHQSREDWEADAQRRSELSCAIESEERAPGVWFDPVQWDQTRERVERQLMHEKWERGILPRQLRHHIPFIYAKSFLYAADRIGKVLARLAERADLPADAQGACKEFYTSFPSLREVRNSAQHVEDRARGLGKASKPLDLKPIENSMISAPGGSALVIDSLNGNHFGATMADGHYGEVEVSAASLATIRQHIEAVHEALPWRGPRRLFPT